MTQVGSSHGSLTGMTLFTYRFMLMLKVFEPRHLLLQSPAPERALLPCGSQRQALFGSLGDINLSLFSAKHMLDEQCVAGNPGIHEGRVQLEEEEEEEGHSKGHSSRP